MFSVTCLTSLPMFACSNHCISYVQTGFRFLSHPASSTAKATTVILFRLEYFACKIGNYCFKENPHGEMNMLKTIIQIPKIYNRGCRGFFSLGNYRLNIWSYYSLVSVLLVQEFNSESVQKHIYIFYNYKAHTQMGFPQGKRDNYTVIFTNI